MLDALKVATTRSNIPADAPTPDIHLLNLWARRLRALRYRRGPKTPAALREVTRHTIAARKHAIYLDRKRWLDYTAYLSEKTSVKTLWATSRSMLGQKREQKAPLTLALKTDTSVEDLADAAGDQFFPQPIATTTNSIPNPYAPVLANSADPMDQPFTLGELETALHNGRHTSLRARTKLPFPCCATSHKTLNTSLSKELTRYGNKDSYHQYGSIRPLSQSPNLARIRTRLSTSDRYHRHFMRMQAHGANGFRST
ncbi:unnamed protein product [Ixodes pacificus]